MSFSCAHTANIRKLNAFLCAIVYYVRTGHDEHDVTEIRFVCVAGVGRHIDDRVPAAIERVGRRPAV